MTLMHELNEQGIALRTGGPLSVHHLLLHLAQDHHVSLHRDPDEVDHGNVAAGALEVWQTMPTEDGSRWRWMVLRQGRVIQEAPGDPHHLRPYDWVGLTVTRSILPDREAFGRFRQALRAAGASCTDCRPRARHAPSQTPVEVLEREPVDA